MFTSDNFNKYPEAALLLQRMIEEKLHLPFFVQCDAQLSRQPEFVELLGRAGCFQCFVGVESSHRQTLLAAHKAQNHPETYGTIVQLCRKNGIATHFSNIIGFPGQTTADVEEHSRILDSLDPDIASFYILTPIPGTEQYADFLKHADGKDEQTIRQIEKAIQRFEAFTGYADFGAFDQFKAKVGDRGTKKHARPKR